MSDNENHRIAHSAPAGEVAGWIVGNGSGTAWRTWNHVGNPCWTNDRDKATRYARREDAELVHREDEDAWSVTPYTHPAPPADLVDAAREALRQIEKYAEYFCDEDFDPTVDSLRAALSMGARDD